MNTFSYVSCLFDLRSEANVLSRRLVSRLVFFLSALAVFLSAAESRQINPSLTLNKNTSNSFNEHATTCLASAEPFDFLSPRWTLWPNPQRVIISQSKRHRSLGDSFNRDGSDGSLVGVHRRFTRRALPRCKLIPSAASARFRRNASINRSCRKESPVWWSCGF